MEYTAPPLLLYIKGRFTVEMMPLFSYRADTGFMHKIPPVIKLIFLPALSTSLFFLAPLYCLLYCFSFILISSAAGFPLLQQLKDLRFVLPYALLLCIAYILSIVNGEKGDAAYFVLVILRVTGAMQTASVFFNTTTSFQLKQGLEKLLPKKLCIFFILFLFFIPMLFSIWAQLDFAWKARGCKNTPAKFFKLLPLLISSGFYRAQKTAYSLQNKSYIDKDTKTD